MNKRLPLSVPALNGREKEFVDDAFATNWVAPLGPHVDAFEREIAARVGVPYAAALNSGTAALHMALAACGIADGDTVLCSSLTFSATCNPIIYQRAIPVFVDSEPDSWNMSPAALERAIAAHPQAKAVIVANLYGTPAQLDAIRDICGAHELLLIEDAAESLGSTWNGRQTGTFGSFGVLSFNGNKIITTSGGGMVLSDDEQAISKIRFWATQARDPARHYQHSELGYNYRLSNVCAAIGRGQLLTLDDRIAQKTAIYETYKAGLADIEEITMNPIPAEAVCNHWLSCITLAEGCPVSPLDILEAFDADNIEGRPIWKPMNLQPYYEKYDFFPHEVGAVPVGDDIFARGLCLPSDVNLTPGDLARVIGVVRRLFGGR